MLVSQRQPKFGGRVEVVATHNADKGHKLNVDKGTDCVEFAYYLSEHIVEDLGHWLFHRTLQDRILVTYDKAQHDVEKESANSCFVCANGIAQLKKWPYHASGARDEP